MQPAFIGTSVLKVFKTLRFSGSTTLAPSFEHVTIKANSLETENELSLVSWIFADLRTLPLRITFNALLE